MTLRMMFGKQRVASTTLAIAAFVAASIAATSMAGTGMDFVHQAADRVFTVATADFGKD